MSLNFFMTDCQEPPRNDKSFGICDDENGEKAYTDITNQNKWIATVNNDNRIQLTFTAIDKCIIQDSDYPRRGRCEGMLTSENHLILIELKRMGTSQWQKKAIIQLESTIKLLMQFHEDKISKYTGKKAYVCNKKFPYFHIIKNATSKKFFDKTGFHLDVNSEIRIK